MKDWILVNFMLCCFTAICVEIPTTTHGNASIIEVVQIKGYKLGRVTMWTEGKLRDVCGDGWDLNDAKVLCREQGDSILSQAIHACGNSCFGKGYLQGTKNFQCTGTEDSLSDCPFEPQKSPCNQSAGVVCSTKLAQLPCPAHNKTCYNHSTYHKKCPPNDTTCSSCITPGPTTITPNSSRITATASVTSPCDCAAMHAYTTNPIQHTAAFTTMRSATIFVLVGVSAFLLLILVGVIIGWVWSCHRMNRSRKSKISQGMQPNPSCTQTMPTQPSVRYSSLGPHNTPGSHTPSQKEERIYHMLEKPEQREETRVMEKLREKEQEEGVYEEVGGVGEEGQEERGGVAYEVPIITESKRRHESAKDEEKAYSTI